MLLFNICFSGLLIYLRNKTRRKLPTQKILRNFHQNNNYHNILQIQTSFIWELEYTIILTRQVSLILPPIQGILYIERSKKVSFLFLHYLELGCSVLVCL